MSMKDNDTTRLLKECDAGVKMAISSINDVMGYIEDEKLKQIIRDSLLEHKKFEREIEEYLSKNGADEKEPGIMAKGMSVIKTNVKLGMDSSDKTVADLMTDGCNMGVKSLQKYFNKYEGADGLSKQLCGRIIKEEEKLIEEMKVYL